MAKDVFDFDWVLDIAPRKVVAPFALSALLTLAYVPASRDWFIEQAQRHVTHELRSPSSTISCIRNRRRRQSPAPDAESVRALWLLRT